MYVHDVLTIYITYNGRSIIWEITDSAWNICYVLLISI